GFGLSRSRMSCSGGPGLLLRERGRESGGRARVRQRLRIPRHRPLLSEAHVRDHGRARRPRAEDGVLVRRLPRPHGLDEVPEVRLVLAVLPGREEALHLRVVDVRGALREAFAVLLEERLLRRLRERVDGVAGLLLRVLLRERDAVPAQAQRTLRADEAEALFSTRAVREVHL